MKKIHAMYMHNMYIVHEKSIHCSAWVYIFVKIVKTLLQRAQKVLSNFAKSNKSSFFFAKWTTTFWNATKKFAAPPLRSCGSEKKGFQTHKICPKNDFRPVLKPKRCNFMTLRTLKRLKFKVPKTADFLD